RAMDLREEGHAPRRRDHADRHRERERLREPHEGPDQERAGVRRVAQPRHGLPPRAWLVLRPRRPGLPRLGRRLTGTSLSRRRTPARQLSVRAGFEVVLVRVADRLGEEVRRIAPKQLRYNRPPCPGTEFAWKCRNGAPKASVRATPSA